MQTALFVYYILKNSNISFLSAFAVLTAFSVTLSIKKIGVPTEDNIDMIYCYAFISELILTFVNIGVMLKNDFITTKIKE